MEVKLVKSVEKGLAGSLLSPWPRRVFAVKAGTVGSRNMNPLRVLLLYDKTQDRMKNRKVFPGV